MNRNTLLTGVSAAIFAAALAVPAEAIGLNVGGIHANIGTNVGTGTNLGNVTSRVSVGTLSTGSLTGTSSPTVSVSTGGLTTGTASGVNASLGLGGGNTLSAHALTGGKYLVRLNGKLVGQNLGATIGFTSGPLISAKSTDNSTDAAVNLGGLDTSNLLGQIDTSDPLGTVNSVADKILSVNVTEPPTIINPPGPNPPGGPRPPGQLPPPRGSNPPIVSNPITRDEIASAAGRDMPSLKLKCRSIMQNPAAFDDSLVRLCRILASL